MIETRLFHGRTHAKILVVPAAALAVCFALAITFTVMRPASWGNPQLDMSIPRFVYAALTVGVLAFFVWPVLRWAASEYTVTDRRVRMRWGVLYKNSREIPLERITQIGEERGILDRIFGCGTLLIYDAAASAPIRFHDVPRMHSVRSTIEEARYALTAPQQPTQQAADQ